MDTSKMSLINGVYLGSLNRTNGETLQQTFILVKEEHLPGIYGFGAPVDISGIHTPQKIFEDTNCLIQLKEPNKFTNGMCWFQLTCTEQQSLSTAYDSLRKTCNKVSNMIDGGVYEYPIQDI